MKSWRNVHMSKVTFKHLCNDKVVLARSSYFHIINKLMTIAECYDNRLSRQKRFPALPEENILNMCCVTPSLSTETEYLLSDPLTPTCIWLGFIFAIIWYWLISHVVIVAVLAVNAWSCALKCVFPAAISHLRAIAVNQFEYCRLLGAGQCPSSWVGQVCPLALRPFSRLLAIILAQSFHDM